MQTIHIMSGIPASGKSTFVDAAPAAAIKLSRDKFRNQLRKELKSNEYFPVKNERHLWLALINDVIKNNPNTDIYIDQTTISSFSLKALLKNLYFPSTTTIVVHKFLTPLLTCIQRNNLRKGIQRVPETVIRNMAAEEEFDPIVGSPTIQIINHE